MPTIECGPESPSYPKWTTLDALMWLFLPKIAGGGTEYLLAYKDGWVLYNARRIKAAAKTHKIPATLLAGVAWEEAGGMPNFVDHITHPVRSFDWSGPSWIDRNLTISIPPEQTSFGSVSIQLRRAAEEMGIQVNTMSYATRTGLAQCLESDAFNIEIVARHLHGLIVHDYPTADTTTLTDEQTIVAGARYNRGTERALQDIIQSIDAPAGSPTRPYSEYGRTLIRRRPRIDRLLRQA